MRTYAFALICILVPQLAHSQVVITEFLYDAAGTDADKEFIELYNGGSTAVDLSKWKVNDGSSHSLNAPPKNGGTGSITLEPGTYALLVDNAAAFAAANPAVTASIIDTVLSLPNAGGTLFLSDETGATADSVSYAKDFGAAGDGNALHKDGALWRAAAPSPGSGAPADTTGGGSETEGTVPPAAATTQQTTYTPVSSYVPPPVPQLFAHAGESRTVIAGADAEFRGSAYNRAQEDVANVRFLWNFGDGTTQDGEAVLHHYDYPGRYVVVLTVVSGTRSLTDSIIVTAEPAALGFTVHPDGSVEITNFAARDLDLSRWIIRSFNREFALPDQSIVLSGESIRIAAQRLGFTVSAESELRYPNGVVALRAGERTHAATVPPPPLAVPVAAAPVARAVAAATPRAPTVPRSSVSVAEAEEASEAAPTSSAERTSNADRSLAAAALAPSSAWLVGLAILAGFAGGALLLARRLKGSEWEIVEETEESR